MTDLLQPLLDDYLHDQGRLRVWSLIVTILGDTVETRQTTIPTTRLGLLLDRLGVSQAAQKTALSRLVKDGWAERSKEGRNTFYGFTDKGREAFVPASRLVYAAPREEEPVHWLMAVSDDPRGVPIAPGIGLWPVDFAPRVRGFSVAGWIDTLPGDLQVVTADHQKETDILTALLRYLEVTFSPDTKLDALAARTVLIHRWRRYVLRHPEIPEKLAPEGWAGLTLRAKLGAAYWALTGSAEDWLQAPGDGFRALQIPGRAYWQRFGYQK
ncbi:hypothetical protein E2K80_15560 [Rhodophyticola sp. CCM32]|uniref:PaaX family transcriptional regulator C-terminal domain-containing protein n=1 Tax=Rhodophyticola sp. CCM32 TaxID=2916397 RepID=UPI00107F71C7|nr:PaaX family transcriptional regulator C-terminal domain-containing protein [Rhodophyticola sp. CCM32]QBY01968.1 hypothetical protein E2K80_15560 [Rhodophyticola sp. CCM32]